MPASYEQIMIEQLCMLVGTLFGGLALGDQERVDFLELVLAKAQSFPPGTPNDRTYRAQAAVAERLRFGADKMLAQHYKLDR